ncbi:MAG TPA: CAP domain-containing protein [Planctomycetaceae bacterium]|nr:CAP domain-containing protein [Planctomycetaceae bacterium]
MWIRTWAMAFAVLISVATLVMRAQVVEEDDTEILKPIAETNEPANRPDLVQAAKQIVEQTNQFREHEKLGRIATNPSLERSAQFFADFMARTSHYGHKANGATPADRAKKFGYEYCIVAENIAYAYSSKGFTTEELENEFVDGWKASPGHRKNMLDPDVTDIGVAVAQGPENGYIFAVQMFGRPKSKALEFSITNESPDTAEYKMGDRTLTLAPRHTRTHQVCRPRDLEFRWPDAEGEGRIVQPHDGDHFVVTKNGETLELRRE